MGENNKDLTTRGTPAETKEDHNHIWSGVGKAHVMFEQWQEVLDGVKKANDGWFVVKFPVFVFSNWKVLAMGFAGGMAMFGKEILLAWGYLQ